MAENLIEAIQSECARVREIIPMYEAIGVAGPFGVAMMRNSIRNAESAIAGDDVVLMVKALDDLRGWKE